MSCLRLRACGERHVHVWQECLTICCSASKIMSNKEYYHGPCARMHAQIEKCKQVCECYVQKYVQQC